MHVLHTACMNPLMSCTNVMHYDCAYIILYIGLRSYKKGGLNYQHLDSSVPVFRLFSNNPFKLS